MPPSRYRNPIHFSTPWLDSKIVGDPRTVAGFDENGDPVYLPVDSFGSGSGGGPSSIVEITDTTAQWSLLYSRDY